MINFGNDSKKSAHEVSKNLYFFSENAMLDCNIYCIVDPDTKEIALFDTGNGKTLNGLFEGLKDLKLDYNNIGKIFITHEHVDHVLGLYPIMEKMKYNPPEIFAYGETASILKKGEENKIFPGNLGIPASMFGVEIVPLKISDLTNEKEVNFSEFNFQIFYTPGHSLGSICYYEPDKKILIPGDVVFRRDRMWNVGSFGRYDFPGGSLETLKKSIAFINDLDVNILLPGHMGIVTSQANQDISLALKTINTLKY
ncbi:MAG: MBL fold metallo-hydrolase [Promethearchaeota archaeon]